MIHNRVVRRTSLATFLKFASRGSEKKKLPQAPGFNSSSLARVANLFRETRTYVVAPNNTGIFLPYRTPSFRVALPISLPKLHTYGYLILPTLSSSFHFHQTGRITKGHILFVSFRVFL